MNPAKSSTSSMVTGALHKCHSCTVNKLPNNHAASDERCPERKKYLSIRQNITGNSRNTARQTNEYVQQAGQNIRAAFRERPMANHSNEFSYADAVRNNAQNCTNLVGQKADDLFSIPELFNIFKGAMSQLKHCKNKMDQISVIASLLEHAVN